MASQEVNRQLRSFGLTVGGLFLLIGILPMVRRAGAIRPWALVVGILLATPGILMPSILRRPHQLWMNLAHVLGWINTKIILTILFYTVFTPVSFITRMLGKDPMNRAFRSDVDTYRVFSEPRDASHLKHQF